MRRNLQGAFHRRLLPNMEHNTTAAALLPALRAAGGKVTLYLMRNETRQPTTAAEVN